MVPLNGPMLVVIAAVVVGSLIIPPIVHATKKAGHVVCHVVTLGHHCKTPAPVTP